MKQRKYRLNVWVSPRMAGLICGRLYGAGEITRAQYNLHMRKINARQVEIDEIKKQKLEKYIAKIRRFYNKGVSD